MFSADNSDRDCTATSSCSNTAGGFECACSDGFIGDGVTCDSALKNFCFDGNHKCHADASCLNTSEGAECFCFDGYYGDGFDQD